jgi:hypothetical protein
MVKGMNGQLSLEGDFVVITRKGLLGTYSRLGDAKIPVDKISYIQMKKPSLTNGYVNFVMPGSSEVKNIEEAGKDQNCVILNPGQYKKFLPLKDEIESKMNSASKAAPNVTVQAASGADEILKLKQLLDAGILTQEEFDKKKAQLLGI